LQRRLTRDLLEDLFLWNNRLLSGQDSLASGAIWDCKIAARMDSIMPQWGDLPGPTSASFFSLKLRPKRFGH
jgi:hypothetical protein